MGLSQSKAKAQDFLKIAPQFQLGHLVTESFHPLTSNLSKLAKEHVASALSVLQAVDHEALKMMQTKMDLLWEMAQTIKDTLHSGHKVYMVGCGATGRLSLVLETLYRQKFPHTDQVMAFMAGGDYALIKSVESFEDKVEYGERQLLELGFGPNDLLLAPTEGGETPFVIGATNLAAKISLRSPYFLYCNPDELLMPIIRSKEVIDNPKIKKVNLTVGPMAISGSTRMQASTVLMLGIGVGLLYSYKDKTEFNSFYIDFLNRLTHSDYRQLEKLTILEAQLYQDKKFLNYVSDANLAISILTDTTERSPTFSLSGFENRSDLFYKPALSYLFIPKTTNSKEAWRSLLGRAPRALDWIELNGKIEQSVLYGFDISDEGYKWRSKELSTVDFIVSQNQDMISFSCLDEKVNFYWGSDPLFNHLMVKMLLNAHSTLVMGLLDRYQGNVMTWVRSSNNKLIDRTARYVIYLLDLEGKSVSYEKVIEKIFEVAYGPQDDGPIVLKVYKQF